ncbi:MAG: TRAP transporter small permease [Imperialibacter sp.]|uniref:TRAP transporter small permease n=1 Tax=Imperialibacter sp. TaxID=2038411 RepID=UPI0032EFE175
MKALRQKIDKITEAGLVILMALLVLDVLWQVASRYILRSPSSFTDELARYLLIWVALIGAAYATGKNMHLAIDILPGKLEGAKAVLLHRFIYFLILIFAALVMVVGGIRLVYISFALGQLAATLQVSLAYVYISLPVSGLLICFYCIHEMIKGRAEV